MFYDLKAKLRQFTDQQQVEKKLLEQFTDRMQKSWKMYWKVGIELSINDNTKSPQIYTLPQFLSMPEKNCGVYWLKLYNLLTNKNSLKSSKQLKIIFVLMPVLSTFQYLQYKQCCVFWHFQNVMDNL